MFCGNCGHKLKANDEFCGICGKATKSNNANTFEQKVEIIEVEEKEKKIESLTSDNIVYVVVGLTMVLSIGFIVVCSLI